MCDYVGYVRNISNIISNIIY